MSSYYKLTISCEPGGCRLHDIYRFIDLRDIKKALLKFLTEKGLYLFCVYGCNITLAIINNGNKIKAINLCEYINVLIDKIIIVKCINNNQIYCLLNDKKYNHNQRVIHEILCNLTFFLPETFNKTNKNISKIIITANKEFMKANFCISNANEKNKKISLDFFEKINQEI